MTAAQLTEWDKVLAEYVINDIAGLETLTTCCQALDRAEALRKQIDKDGEWSRPGRRQRASRH